MDDSHTPATSCGFALRRASAVIAMVFAVLALVIWSREVWLRPRFLWVVDDEWLAGGMTAGLVAAAMIWPFRTRWWWRASAALALAAVTLLAGQRFRDEVTLRHLLSHEEKYVERMRDRWNPSNYHQDRWQRVRPSLDWLERFGVPVPERPAPL